MRKSSDPEEEQFKDARRLRTIFPKLTDWDRYTDRWLSWNHRNWKTHSKCRHQWEKHELPVFTYLFRDAISAVDHNRKWILECLRQKKTCVFNVHNDCNLYDVLDSLAGEGICTTPLRLDNGFFEVTLVKQVSKHPHKKTSPGDKGTKGKYRCRHNQRARQNKRQEAIDAVAERTRRASRKNNDGIALAPLPAELLVTPPKVSVTQTPRKNNPLWQKAMEDHIKGVSRNNRVCLTLLNNYKSYSLIPKAHVGLAPYEHDYHKIPNTLDQCCAWLTGHVAGDFPAWVMTLLTDSVLSKTIAKRVFNWTIGDDSARECYGLSKNEAREIVHLPASIENESQAIVAAIARARHCDATLTQDLVTQVPVFWPLLDERQRESTRKIVDWLGSLPAAPCHNKLHDLFDFFSHSHLLDNPFFSFKGRTLPSVERMMQEWHLEQQQERKLANMKQYWDCQGYNYSYNETYHFAELHSARALMLEGRAQHNCVFSYCDHCLSGRTSIVSMRGFNPNERLTIEINNNLRRIVQIRGPYNRLATREEMRIVRTFASVKNLSIYC